MSIAGFMRERIASGSVRLTDERLLFSLGGTQAVICGTMTGVGVAPWCVHRGHDLTKNNSTHDRNNNITKMHCVRLHLLGGAAVSAFIDQSS